MTHHARVCAPSTGHGSLPFQKQKHYTKQPQSVAWQRSPSSARADMSPQGLIHTLGRTRGMAPQPGSTVPALPTAVVHGGSGLAGAFLNTAARSCSKFPQRKKITELTPHQCLSYSPTQPLSSIKLFVLTTSVSGTVLIPRSGGSVSRVAGPAGAQRAAPKQGSPGHLVWEPGALRRHTRG